MNIEDSGFSADKRRYLEKQHSDSIVNEGTYIDSRELTIGDIVRYLRDAFPQVVVGALIACIVATSALFLFRFVSPPVTSYRTGIVITMYGAGPGKYPNGTDFSLTDLRSPVVLDEVFRTNKLSDFGINLADFMGMVSIEAFSPAYNSVTERFRTRLDNKTLTFEERKAVESEFNEALSGLSSKGVLVTLTTSESKKIPELLAKQVVNEVPATWAKIFTERLGVANLPVPVSGAKLINVQFLKELDFPLAYDYLSGQATKLQSQLAAIESLPGAASFTSVKSGKGIADLKREADAIDQYRLKLNLKPIVDQGLSRDPTVTVLIYKNQINSLEKDAGVQSEYSEKVTDVISDFRTNKGTLPVGLPQGAPAMSPVGTQFDGAFVDKIIELSKQGAGVEFEQGLLQKKLEMENLSVGLTDQKNRLIERRDAIVNNTLTNEVRIMLEGKFLAGLELATGELNGLWTDSFGFLDELNNKRLNFDKALYRLIELPDDMRLEKPDLLSMRSVLMAFALVICGAMVGFLNFSWRRALKSH